MKASEEEKAEPVAHEPVAESKPVAQSKKSKKAKAAANTPSAPSGEPSNKNDEELQAKLEELQRANKASLEAKEREVSDLQVSLRAKEREIEALKQQHADALQ